jgi:hypothetical protein
VQCYQSQPEPVEGGFCGLGPENPLEIALRRCPLAGSRGTSATEIVFSYPGIGWLILQAIQNQDYFLLQGCFLFIIIGVLIANFAIDIVYILIDPRTRLGMQGEAS